jgi:hypothetical protein
MISVYLEPLCGGLSGGERQAAESGTQLQHWQLAAQAEQGEVMLRRREVLGWSVWALMIVWPLALLGTDKEIQEPKTPIASWEVQATRIDWRPKVDYEHLVLTVAGPGDFYARQEFGTGQAPLFSLVDSKGNRLPDGSYAYELRVVPRLDPGAPERLAGAQDNHESGLELPNGGKLPERPLVQSGYFSIEGGSFLDLSDRVRSSGREKPPLPRAATKQVTSENACIGDLCGAGDDSFFTLNLKSSLISLNFEDVPDGITFTRDWTIFINPFPPARDAFIIKDQDAGTIPFTLEGNASQNSLYVRSNGNVGLGTSTPATQLHILGTDSGSRNKILVENAGAQNFRELLEIRNNGGPVFILEDTSVPQRWAQGTSGSSFVIDEQAHAGVEYTFSNTGNLTIAGILTQGSSRDLKTDFAFLDPKDALARLSALPVSLWSYKTENGVRHIGPMAEDFHQAFGLGEDDKHIAPGDQAGIALLAAQGLNQAMQEKDQQIAELKGRIEALERLIQSLTERPARP